MPGVRASAKQVIFNRMERLRKRPVLAFIRDAHPLCEDLGQSLHAFQGIFIRRNDQLVIPRIVKRCRIGILKARQEENKYGEQSWIKLYAVYRWSRLHRTQDYH